VTHLDTPERRARQVIDAALDAAGWRVQSRDAVNVPAGRGVAVRDFRLKPGHGYADCVHGQTVGVIGASEVGHDADRCRGAGGTLCCKNAGLSLRQIISVSTCNKGLRLSDHL
jgi:hypothetical protein